MKAIMMSIRPQWISKILNKEKTIEIRKRFPKDYVGWVYIYCTKEQGLVFDSEGKGLVNSKLFPYAKNCPEHDRLINGKVVARFWCDKVEEQPANRPIEGYVFTQGCLTSDDILNYCGYKTFYAIHITKLEIFDRPKEISEFEDRTLTRPRNINPCVFANGYFVRPLTRAPQSYCFIEI